MEANFTAHAVVCTCWGMQVIYSVTYGGDDPIRWYILDVDTKQSVEKSKEYIDREYGAIDLKPVAFIPQ